VSKMADMNLPEITRHKTRVAKVGSLTIGGDSPITVQSMTNTRTADAAATIAQVLRLAEAGAEIVRVATPTQEDTAALPEIVAASPVPIVADVHFHFQRAIEALQAGVAKIRLNPGNISDRDKVKLVISEAASRGAAIRIGVNEGSISDRRDMDKYRQDREKPLAELMAEKMAEYLAIFEQEGFDNLVLSAKSHDAYTTVAVNRELARRWNYPLHLGVTHAGTPATAAIRSAAALGTLLCEGIGDTLRISYAGDPVNEVMAANELLYSLRLRKREGIELIACPTCGRLQMDLSPVIAKMEELLKSVKKNLTVAIMGCVVNGPGEAENADIAICAGRDKAVLYRRGQRIKNVKTEEIIPTLLKEIDSFQ